MTTSDATSSGLSILISDVLTTYALFALGVNLNSPLDPETTISVFCISLLRSTEVERLLYLI